MDFNREEEEIVPHNRILQHFKLACVSHAMPMHWQIWHIYQCQTNCCILPFKFWCS